MHEFFRGWRRKAGLVTLVMALVLTGLWMRSYVIGDFVTVWDSTLIQVISGHGVVLVRMVSLTWEEDRRYEWHAVATSKFAIRNYLSEVDLCWNRGGFLAGTSWTSLTRRVAFSYSLVVLPLTLLSAWLLLSRPRPTQSMKESSHA